MKCAVHNLEVMGSNSGRVTFVCKSYWTKSLYLSMIGQIWRNLRPPKHQCNTKLCSSLFTLESCTMSKEDGQGRIGPVLLYIFWAELSDFLLKKCLNEGEYTTECNIKAMCCTKRSKEQAHDRKMIGSWPSAIHAVIVDVESWANTPALGPHYTYWRLSACLTVQGPCHK